MWEGLLMLLTLSTVMGIASFLAGLLPLSFGLSQNHSRAISAIGTGLLVGTCLIIIIPEGIETLYDSSSYEEPSRTSSSSSSSTTSTTQYYARASEEVHEHGTQPHAFVGTALVAGFILMYLIDQVPKHGSNTTSVSEKPLHISLANLSQGPHRASSPSRLEEEEVLAGDPAVASPATSQGSATTIGLVIHAAADGIALAASSFINESSVGFVVFIALMFHKAPAAFGLTSVLLKQDLSKRQARAHLLVFSLAAPIGALATWTLVNVIAGGHIEGGESTKFWTGLLLLFSGGTFLYVAMHTMQEHGDSHQHPLNGYTNGSAYANSRIQHADHNHPIMRDTLLSVLGMVLPLLAQASHAH